jgi:hypothetical protein
MNVAIKVIKYIVIVLLIAIMLFFVLEIISFSLKINLLYKEGCFKDKTRIESIKGIWKYYSDTYKDLDIPPISIKEFRKPIIKNNNNPSIILMGCSFTYGHKLNDNETFAAVLSDYTNRTVYNWGITSSSPREMLYLLQHKYYISKLIKDRDNVEYVIYTYIPDHIFRLYYNLAELSPIYKLKNGSELIYKENSLYNATFFSREMQKVKFFLSSKSAKNKLFSIYMAQINNEIKNTFKNKDKNTKFVILVFYPEGISDWSKIADIDDNIIVIDVQDMIDVDLLNEKYIVETGDIHPNVEAWKLIVPKMMNYLDSIEQ